VRKPKWYNAETARETKNLAILAAILSTESDDEVTRAARENPLSRQVEPGGGSGGRDSQFGDIKEIPAITDTHVFLGGVTDMRNMFLGRGKITDIRGMFDGLGLRDEQDDKRDEQDDNGKNDMNGEQDAGDRKAFPKWYNAETARETKNLAILAAILSTGSNDEVTRAARANPLSWRVEPNRIADLLVVKLAKEGSVWSRLFNADAMAAEAGRRADAERRETASVWSRLFSEFSDGSKKIYYADASFMKDRSKLYYADASLMRAGTTKKASTLAGSCPLCGRRG
jgi:hypothetical protein